MTINNSGAYNLNYVGSDTNVLGDLTVTGGDYQDHFNLGYGSVVNGDVTISTGSGADAVRFNGSAILGRTVMNLGADGDQVSMYSFNAHSPVDISSGIGSDQIDLEVTNVYSDLAISTSSGDDRVSVQNVYAYNLDIHLGTASFDFGDRGPVGEYLSIEDSCIEASTTINTSIGSRFILLSDSHLGELAIATSAGKDSISLVDLDAYGVNIRTGSGSDRVELHGDIDFDYLDVAMGSGADNFYANEFVSFDFGSHIHGGSGEDSAELMSEILEFFPTLESFENQSFFTNN